jgi:uncharacterized membrane protein
LPFWSFILVNLLHTTSSGLYFPVLGGVTRIVCPFAYYSTVCLGWIMTSSNDSDNVDSILIPVLFASVQADPNIISLADIDSDAQSHTSLVCDPWAEIGQGIFLVFLVPCRFV